MRRLTLRTRPHDRAFEQLYERHARDVYHYALALLSNPADAEDVTQTTFLNAYRAFEKGERPEKPHNWLIAIAHNVCRMRWRQAGARPREVALDEAPEPSVHEEERPDLDEVLTALALLSFNQRAALVMRELEGRSYQEIAEVLGTTVSAVEALLFRARRRLQVNRKSLGAIAAVPLPGSLTTFVGAGAGGGAVAAGGSALALKAAVVVAAGAVTAGVGYRSSAVADPHQAAAPTPVANAVAKTQAREASSGRAATRSTKRQSPQHRATTHRRSATRPTTATAAGAAPAPAAAPTSSAPAPVGAPPAAPAAPATTTAPVTAPSLPVTVPPLPPPPPVTVSVPTLPVLPPVPPVTVTVPTLPLPPIPPPLGK